MKTNKRYSHRKYTWTNRFGTIRHNWEFLGVRGGLNFHVSITPDYPPSCGLEFHHLAPINGEDSAPDHLQCPLTGGRCWHDGTSLYAREHLWPIIEGLLKAGNHQTIFAVLEREADRQFYPKSDETN